MIPLFCTKTIRDVDDYAIRKLRIPGIILMENASLEVFKFASEKLIERNKSGSIGFICGKGNNGGDGFALARHFINNHYKVIVICLFDEAELTQDCRTNFVILKQMISNFKDSKLIIFRNVKDLSPLKSCDMIVDAMLGSGVQGELKEPFQSIVNKVNTLNSIKLSVDIPTGLDADKGYSSLMFKADLTVTLGELKPGLFFGDGYAFAGQIQKGNIGISPDYYPSEKTKEFLLEPKDVVEALPIKIKSANKYSAGKVLTIAGSGKYSGAAILTAKSVLKVGAGASVLCFPKSIRNFVHKNLSEVVLQEYEDNGKEYLKAENLEKFSSKIRWADVIALGPGLGREAETQKAVIQLLRLRKFRNIVIDADALFAISDKKYKKIDLTNFILTPHYGEFCSLIGIELEEFRKDILTCGRKFVKETGTYLVLKGAPTMIFLPNGKVLINTVGNAGMAKFGTGDVLTGVIAGLLSQVKDIEKALIAAVYIHSLAADLLTEKYTELGFTATNLMNNIPSAIRYVRNSFV
jgi:NAD(P)H-hydrate epimerase